VLGHDAELSCARSIETPEAAGPILPPESLGCLGGKVTTRRAKLDNAVTSEVVADAVYNLGWKSVKVCAWWS
jgi:hypothetical protein